MQQNLRALYSRESRERHRRGIEHGDRAPPLRRAPNRRAQEALCARLVAAFGAQRSFENERRKPGLPPLRKHADRVRQVEEEIYTFASRHRAALPALAAAEIGFHVLGVAEIYLTLWLLNASVPTLLTAFVFEGANRLITVVFKVVDRLGHTWRALNGGRTLMTLLFTGRRFKNGILVETASQATAAA